jgi:release factor glutamine methyltransferase
MSDAAALDRLSAAGLDVAAAVRAVRDAFTAAGQEGASGEARMLVGHVLGLDLTGLTVGSTRPVDGDAARRLAAAARRRLAGEPLQRILGTAWFHGLEFRLAPETLVPRPDTETLVEAVLARFPVDDPFVFADLGVGSGAVMVAVLAARPFAFGVGTDLSQPALVTARANAELNGVGSRACFVRGSFAAMLAPGAFDAVVSNPPYIATAEIGTLDADVRLHDPHLALDGGADGLDAYRAIVPQAAKALKPGGFFALEIGWRQAADVGALVAGHGFERVETVRDLAGRDRVIAGRRHGGGA